MKDYFNKGVVFFLFMLLLTMPSCIGVSSAVINESMVAENNILSKEGDIQLKVMTFNIQYGKGKDGIQDLSRIADVIREADVDIVGLQEVERFSPRSKFANQLKWLAEELDMYGVYGPTLSIGYFQYGNAMLSRYPIVSWENILLRSSRENRGLLMAEIDLGPGKIAFFGTHLGLSQEERLEHLDIITEKVSEIELPLVLVGDWNNTPDSQEVERVLEHLNDAHALGGIDNGFTFAFGSAQASVRIDYIFTSKDLEVHKTKAIDTNVSDHLPVVSKIKVGF